MTAVAGALARAERAGEDGRKPVPLPVGEAAPERRDALVAELLERPGGERGPAAAGAVDEDAPVAIRNSLLDARLERAARDVDRVREVALVPLVALADVQEERHVAVVQRRHRLRGIDLVDLRLRLFE